ncbi:tRNA dihydrouridine synthase DusB [bacterium]|nr:MAG: tRNA dihydrouridine synthase DusB [bacterium]
MQIAHINLGEKPVVLAPMEDVTDHPFRLMCKRKGASVVYTEFISSEGLIREANKSMHKLTFVEEERPFAIQIFGGDEEVMAGATKVAVDANPDFIDINFGCPVYKVVNKNAGAACLRDIGLMERMAGMVVDAAGDYPVTVKTRLGWDDNSIRINEVALMLQSLGIKTLTVHARTRAQGYKGEARWEYLKALKNTPGLHIPIIGNGDVTTPQDAKRMFDETGVDGVMIGRAAIGNPWIFEQTKHFMSTGELLPEPNLQERLHICAEQLKASVEHHGEQYGVIMMKKHYGNYLKGIRNGKHLRIALMEYKEMNPILELLSSFTDEIPDSFAVPVVG